MPSPEDVYVLKAVENLTNCHKNELKREKAFKTVFEKLLTSTTPKHVLTASPFPKSRYNFAKSFLFSSKRSEEKYVSYRLNGNNFELTHQSGDDEKKCCYTMPILQDCV